MSIKLKQICFKIKPNPSQISFRKLIFPQNLQAVASFRLGRKKMWLHPFLARIFAWAKTAVP
jgi:hypothetical protein